MGRLGPAWDRFGDYLDINPGWFSIIQCLCSNLQRELSTNFPNTTLTFLQIKEKFGTLRIYVDIVGEGADKIDSLIKDAEHKSSITCHVCEAEGFVRPTGWVQTLCNEHYIDAMK